MIRKPLVHRVNRRRKDPSNPPAGTIASCTVSVVGGKMRIAAPLPLIVNGVPTDYKAGASSGGAATMAATSISVVNPTTVDVGFAASAVAGALWIITNNNPALRTNTGGFVSAATGTF